MLKRELSALYLDGAAANAVHYHFVAYCRDLSLLPQRVTLVMSILSMATPCHIEYVHIKICNEFSANRLCIFAL